MTWTGRKHRWLGALTMVLTCVWFHDAASAQPSERDTPNSGSLNDTTTESTKLARQLWDWYGQASDLHDAGKLDEAWEIYQRIWQHRRTYDVATSMGSIAMHRQQYAAAAYYYHIALQEMVPTQTPEFVASVTKEFKLARSKSTEVVLDVHPPDLEGLVIEDVERRVRLDVPLYLSPGTTELRASAPGFAPQAFTVDARPGFHVTWSLNFQRVHSTQPSPPPQNKEQGVPKETTRHPGVVFPIGGVLTAGLAVGAVLSFKLGERRYDEIKSINLTPNACLGRSPADDCSRVQTLKEQGERADVLGVALSAGAGVMALATIVTWSLWESEVPVAVSANASGADVRWAYEF